MSSLIVTIQNGAESLTREVSKERFTIGRSVDCDIQINDHHVSRVHLIVQRNQDDVWIEDKNSSNGTYLNDNKIVQGTLVNVVAADKVKLGRSEYLVSFEVKPDEIKALSGNDLHKVEKPPLDHTQEVPIFQSPEDVSPQEKVVVEELPQVLQVKKQSPVSDNVSPSRENEARKKAAQIILEAEEQAEKKVQAIYQQARETQELAELQFKERMDQAQKQADLLLADYEKQGQELVQEARAVSQRLREEVDVYLFGLKEKAKKTADELLAEATRSADKVRSEALDEGLKKAQDEADRLLVEAKMQVFELVDKAKAENAKIVAEIATHKEESEEKKKALEAVLEKLKGNEDSLKNLEKEVSDLQEKVTKENLRLEELTVQLKDKSSEGVRIQKELDEKKKSIEGAIQSLQDKQAQLSIDVREIEHKKEQLLKEYDSQKAYLVEKIEKDKIELLKQEEARSEEIRLDFAKKTQKMEQTLIDEIVQKKTSMTKEVYSAVEKEIVKVLEAGQWRKISGAIEAGIVDAVEGKLASMSQSTAASKKPVDFFKKRSNERFRWTTIGLILGAVGLFGAQIVFERIRKDKNPMLTRVQSEAQQRKEDLERRRFNPPQVDEIKDTFVDSVIYTKNFADIYLSQEYQQRLYKEASVYLLKTWRVDESKTLQVLAIEAALVKELADKKSKIHPDFVKDALKKMKTLESENLARIKDLLGSEVRVESLQKFEKQFFMDELQRRR